MSVPRPLSLVTWLGAVVTTAACHGSPGPAPTARRPPDGAVRPADGGALTSPAPPELAWPDLQRWSPPATVRPGGIVLTGGGAVHHERVDLDGDGVSETLDASADGGSGYGSVTLRVQHGRTGRGFTLESLHSFGEPLDVTALPPGLAAEPRLLLGLIDRWLGPGRLRSLPDDPLPEGLAAAPAAHGTLAWLVAWHLHPPLPATGPLAALRAVPTGWRAGPPTQPPSEAVVLRAPHLARVGRAVEDRPGEAPAPPARADEAAPAWALASQGTVHHGPLVAGERCGDLALHLTRHAVAVHDVRHDRHAWVFVSTNATKLRWPSLRRVRCAGDLVLVERSHGNEAPRSLWAVSLRRGRIGRIAGWQGEVTWLLDPAARTVRLGHTALSLAEIDAALAGPRDWQTAFDLDGDGRPDRIDVAFSGGAHCCHTLTVTPTRTGAPVALPFALDGGYVGGLDLGQPDGFFVGDQDGDSLPDLLLRIATYDGRPGPLPAAWRQQYGIRTHRIRVSFPGGKLLVADQR